MTSSEPEGTKKMGLSDSTQFPGGLVHYGSGFFNEDGGASEHGMAVLRQLEEEYKKYRINGNSK